MSSINFKKLITRSEESAILRDLAGPDGSGYAIYDAAGDVVAGRAAVGGEKLPVEAEGNLIGWVSGGRDPALLAALLRYFANREMEKKSLIKETLEKYKEISVLYEVAGRIAACLDISEVVKLVIDEALKVIHADNVSLMIVDHGSGELKILGAAGRECHPKTRIMIRSGIAGHVAASGRAEIVNNVENDPRFVRGANAIHSLICAPLKIKERVVGVMNFSCEQLHHFTAEDLKMAEALAFQTAMSIENARFVNELRESEQKFRHLYENAVEGIFLTTPAGRITSANPSLARILGYDSPEEVISEVTDLAHQVYVVPEDRETFRETVSKHGRITGFETQMLRKDGNRFWGLLSARAVHDDSGRIRCYEGSLLDITERKEKEEAKRQHEAAEIKSRFIRETFGKYLSDEIVDTILENPAGLTLGGEKRTVTIMMSDLRGFTAIGERLPAEDVVGMLNIYLEIMTGVILKYQGTIDEFIGDAILVIFGAPIRRDDDAVRAVACALEMQLAMHEVNARNRVAGYPELVMGIGINTGVAVVGNIGSRKRIKYGVVGSSVNLTSRIESYTVGGQILISEETVDACGGLLRIDGQQEVMPKGVKAPITIYEVGGIHGTHNLFLSEKSVPKLPELSQPLPIRFAPLVDKDAGVSMQDGLIHRMSAQMAEVQAEKAVERLTNLRIALLDDKGQEIATDIYAKVIGHVEGRTPAFRIHFTSIAPEILVVMKEIADTQEKGVNA